MLLPEGFQLRCKLFAPRQASFGKQAVILQALELRVQLLDFRQRALQLRLRLRQPMALLLQAGALGKDLHARCFPQLFLLAEAACQGFHLRQRCLGVLPGGMLSADFSGALQQIVIGLAFIPAAAQARSQLLAALLCALRLPSQCLYHATLFLQGGFDLAHIEQQLLLTLAQAAQLFQLRLQLLQAAGALRFFAQLSQDLLQAAIQALDFFLYRLPSAGRLGAIVLPDIQPQDAAQDALALARALLGELVCLALQKEGGVDKGLVIQAQGILDTLFGLAQRVLGQRLPPALLQLRRVEIAAGGVVRRTVLLQDMELQHGRLLLDLAAQQAVNIAFIGKDQAHFGGAGLGVDQRIVALACNPEKRPGNGVQQGGLAGPIGAGNTGQVQPG